MKVPMLLLGLCASLFASSQEFTPELDKIINRSKARDLLYKSPLKTFDEIIVEKGTPVSPGVYALPQDNMPCIVPDTSGIVAMPNAYKPTVKNDAGAIPNPMSGWPLLRKKTDSK